MSFRVDLETYQGPLDLLLYLVRKSEVEISEISVAAITNQYLDHLALLEQLEVDDVGEFIEVASLLIEIKSKTVLPQEGEDTEPIEDPRDELVARLLEYKKYKDAAGILEDNSRRWQQRYARLADDLPPRRFAPDEQPVRRVELWDLVSSFGRMMREHELVKPASIVYDDTPIQVYMGRIHEKLSEHKRAAFTELFVPGMHKSAMIGLFLAVLELVRHHDVVARQDELHGEIVLVPGEKFNERQEFSGIEDYKS